MAEENLTAIVLAAGSSTRMGRPKLFLRIDGETLLRRSVIAATKLCDAVLVVTGPYAEATGEHLRDLAPKVTCVHNPDHLRGMGGSVATGVVAALSSEPTAFVILVADQPEVDTAYLLQLRDRWREQPRRMVATAYLEGPGVPAIFPFAYHRQLLGESGAGGARGLLRNGEHPVVLHTPPAPLIDLDTPEDYRSFTGQDLPE